MVKPYPTDSLCVKCHKFVPELLEKSKKTSEADKNIPKEFKPQKKKPSDKDGVRTKDKSYKFSLEDEKIFLKGKEEYVIFCGITSKERTPLFYTKEHLKYLLELTNNLDYIATGILRGDLDKMLLVREDGNKIIEEKCQFYEKDNIIYIVYGLFPDKKGKWILEQMAREYESLILKFSIKNVNELTPLEKSNIDRGFKPALKSILDSMELKEVLTDKDISYVEDWIRVDYLGVSSMSIGVVSLLLDDQGALNLDLPVKYDDPNEDLEMKESQLTAKIEAIAANTPGNTGAYPRWIAVRLKYQQYRFITFKKYPNDYFLSLLSEGNLKKIPKAEDKLNPLIYHVIDTPFEGNLKPFNQLKATLKDMFNHDAELEHRKFY